MVTNPFFHVSLEEAPLKKKKKKVKVMLKPSKNSSLGEISRKVPKKQATKPKTERSEPPPPPAATSPVKKEEVKEEPLVNGIIKPEIKEESDEMEAEQPQFDEKPVSC